MTSVRSGLFCPMSKISSISIPLRGWPERAALIVFYMTTTTHVYNVSTGWQPKVEEGDIARGSLLDHLGDVADVLDRGPIGLLTDMDGTISEIVPQPDGAQ